MAEPNNTFKVPTYLTIGKVISYAMYIWVLYGIIVLGISVFLQLFAANPETPFVRFIYHTSATFLEPFRGIFPPKSVGEAGYVDVAAVFAMIVYGFVGWGFSALIDYIQTKISVLKRNAAIERVRANATAPKKSV